MNLRRLYCDVVTMRAIVRRRRPGCGPRVVQINISDNCNLDCTICNRSSMGVSGLLDADRVMALVDELYGMGTQEVFFHGFGEPALHPGLPGMIQHMHRHTPRLRKHLITNGTWDSPRLLAALEAGRVHVRFSLHAGDAQTWQRIHPRDDVGNFARAGDNLRHLAGLAPDRVEVLYVICRTNCRNVPEMAAYAADHGVTRVLFRPMRLFKDASGRFMNAHLMPTSQEFREAAAAIARCRRERRGRLSVHAVPFDQNDYDEAQGRPSSRAFYLSRSCYIGYVLTVVERDGNVWGCLPESSDGEPLGNIHQTSFREIWYGARYEAFRHKQLLLDKDALDHQGCHSYCQHLETNVRLNRFVPLRRGVRTSCPGASA